jgi:hypothetical protein
MADAIGTRLQASLRNLADTIEHLKSLQLVSSDNNFLESIPASWLLREFFMDICERQFDELFELCNKQVSPLLADFDALAKQRLK